MLASLAIVPAYTIAVLAPAGPDDGCPSPREVNSALSAHLPGAVAPFGQPVGANALRLSVTTEASGTFRLDLTDPDGGPLLHRSLPGRDLGHDCPALAETAALIVDRYWHEVGYDVPLPAPPTQPPPAAPAKPAPPPGAAPNARAGVAAPLASAGSADRAASAAPRAPPAPNVPHPTYWIAGAAVGRVGDSGSPDFSAEVAFAVEKPIERHPVGLRLSAGWGQAGSAEWTGGSATLTQLPVRMGGYLSLDLGPGQLEPGIGLDLDLYVASVNESAGARTTLRASPGMDAAVGWAVPFEPGIYARALGEAGAGVPYRFVATSSNTAIWTTRRITLRLGIELGFWFP